MNPGRELLARLGSGNLTWLPLWVVVAVWSYVAALGGFVALSGVLLHPVEVAAGALIVGAVTVVWQVRESRSVK